MDKIKEIVVDFRRQHQVFGCAHHRATERLSLLATASTTFLQWCKHKQQEAKAVLLCYQHWYSNGVINHKTDVLSKCFWSFKPPIGKSSQPPCASFVKLLRDFHVPRVMLLTVNTWMQINSGLNSKQGCGARLISLCFKYTEWYLSGLSRPILVHKHYIIGQERLSVSFIPPQTESPGPIMWTSTERWASGSAVLLCGVVRCLHCILQSLENRTISSESRLWRPGPANWRTASSFRLSGCPQSAFS